MKKASLALFTSISIIFSFNAFALETKAPHAILVDYDTDTVIFEKEADVPTVPSSMSKLMTVYVIFDKLKKGELKLNERFLVSENAWRKQGSKMFLHVGSSVTLEDLIKGIIIQSGNDACITAAEGIAGTEEEFVNILNEKAKELGLTNSHFVNSTGWPDDNHKMSMRDLSILSKHLINDFPEYYSYFAEREFVYNNIKQQNRNLSLNRFNGVDGLKTGHTDAGGYGIAMSAQQKNRRLIVVVNGLSSM
ncbi:MAG: D-alanyl-D-alanine carboxypeptidase, partial [Alphaproteobacteria bacterium]|nr:D-alanyl-D-alanine carboxypeptidase [Alphaproteobacteria bacterium]